MLSLLDNAGAKEEQNNIGRPAMAEAFGILLKRLRLRANYGLREFAEIVDVLPSNYAAVESGNRNPWRDVDKLDRIASALGLERGSVDHDTFFISARGGGSLPPDLQSILDREEIPLLLRTVKELQLSPDELRKLIADLKKRKSRRQRRGKGGNAIT